MAQRIKKGILAGLLLFLLMQSSQAQIRLNYHFGSIGTTGDTSVKISEPVLIGYNKCFEITNGVSKFSTPKSGAFAITCNEATPKISLQVHAYPNPTINEFLIRSLINFPQKGWVKYRVVITDVTGKLLREVQTDIAAINAGLPISVKNLPMGYFIVTLYSEKELIQSFKMLKAV